MKCNSGSLTLVLLGVAVILLAGCATHRPAVSDSPPAQLDDDYSSEEELDVVFIDTEEEEASVEQISDEEAVTPEPKQSLSWDEIEQLGETYTVIRGDTLGEIASRYDVGTGLLSRINDLADPNLIRTGQTLLVIRGPFRAEVDKSEKVLNLYLAETFIKSYPITIGRNNSTPEGEFKVLRKMKNPAWTDPYNRTILTADDPEYPLGTRWIEFKAPPGAYGIHGSKNAEEIGLEASFGCVRVLHPQEEELYDFLIPGSPVLIRE